MSFPRGPQFGPNGMRHFEQSLAAVASKGLSPADKIRVISIVDDYVFGYVIHEAQDIPADERHKICAGNAVRIFGLDR